MLMVTMSTSKTKLAGLFRQPSPVKQWQRARALSPQLSQLRLNPLPLPHQLLDLGGEGLLLGFELLHLVAGGAVKEGGIAEELVDGVDARFGLLHGGGHLVALLRQLFLALLAAAGFGGIGGLFAGGG